MKKSIVFFFLFLIISVPAISSAEIKNIEMSDGSIISGEIVSLAGGIYTIKTESLGTVKIEESKIRSIRPKSGAGNPDASASQVSGLQDKMMNDKGIMAMIQSLQNDPDFKKILEDPAMMKAVEESDLTTLMANPQFMKLLDNATVKDIQKKVK